MQPLYKYYKNGKVKSKKYIKGNYLFFDIFYQNESIMTESKYYVKDVNITDIYNILNHERLCCKGYYENKKIAFIESVHINVYFDRDGNEI